MSTNLIKQLLQSTPHPKRAQITVLLVEVAKPPSVLKTYNDVKTLSNVIGGEISIYGYFVADNVFLIADKCAKTVGRSLNRAIEKDGETVDIIAGTFILCEREKDELTSLSPQKIEKYTKMFSALEKFEVLENELRINKTYF